jgi:hypothetical protein
MRITIDYNPENNNFSVLVDRGSLSNGSNPYPPPPPYNNEFAEMTTWLNDVFAACTEKFKDQKVAAIRYKYDPKQGVQEGFTFLTEDFTPPKPPPFIR